MTTIVNPSTGREATHESLSATSRWGGVDWIVPGDIDVNATNEGLSGAPLNGASITTSGGDVSIDTFEAFIGGAYVASDDATIPEHTHSLTESATNLELFLGYDHSATDTIIFGPASDFSANDPRVRICRVGGSTSFISNVFDRRPIGRAPNRGVPIAATYNSGINSPLELDTGVLSVTYPEYDIVIYRETHESNETYQQMRLNGTATANYYQDIYEATTNTFTSVDEAGEWRYLAATAPGTGFAYQVIRVSCPREVISNGDHSPVMSVVQNGVGKNREVAVQGHLEVDTPAVERINLFSGGGATGWVEIYGRGAGNGLYIPE